MGGLLPNVVRVGEVIQRILATAFTAHHCPDGVLRAVTEQCRVRFSIGAARVPQVIESCGKSRTIFLAIRTRSLCGQQSRCVLHGTDTWKVKLEFGESVHFQPMSVKKRAHLNFNIVLPLCTC